MCFINDDVANPSHDLLKNCPFGPIKNVGHLCYSVKVAVPLTASNLVVDEERMRPVDYSLYIPRTVYRYF